MNSTTFDSNGTTIFMNDVKKAMEELAAKHGVTLAKHTARYGGDHLNISLTMETVGESGVSDAAKKRWARTEWMDGLHPDMFGRNFTANGDTFEVVDLAPRSPKYPVLAKKVGTDKIYKFNKHALRQLLMEVTS